MTPVGVVTGLTAEADCLGRAAGTDADGALAFFTSGGNADRAYAGAKDLLAQGCGGLISFGLAGGLAAELEPGDIVIADRVVLPDGRAITSDGDWRARWLAAAPPGIREATIAGSDTVVATAAAKQDLALRTGAAAVDMESHAVARAADEAARPWIALRAIADPAGRGIPAPALAGQAEDGSIRPLAVLVKLATQPWQVPALIRLAADSAAGFAALRRVARVDGAFYRLP